MEGAASLSLQLLQELALPEDNDYPVGARLAVFHLRWQALLGQCRASTVVQSGVTLQWVMQPQLTRRPIAFPTNNSAQDLQEAVDALVKKGAVEQVRFVHAKGFFSRLFLVPKKTEDLRPVIDLSVLNRHLVIPHFKMETPQSVKASIREGEWAASIDIRDAYLHVPMAHHTKKYLRFVVNKKVYQFRCLPFGLATSPREFTKLLRPVVQLLRLQGVKLHVYLDDWLVRGSSVSQVEEHSQVVIRLLQHLGWVINFPKSDLVPSQHFEFIGMKFNTDQFTVSPLSKMRLKVQATLDHWSRVPSVSARDLHRLLGVLNYMAALVHRGRLRLRPLQWWSKEVWDQVHGSWYDRIVVPGWILHQIAWWASPAVEMGLSLRQPETEMTLYTDASRQG